MKNLIISRIILSVFILSIFTGCFYAVRTPPPPAKVEVRPVRPYAGDVWIDGHWTHRHGRWVWAPGHWRR